MCDHCIPRRAFLGLLPVALAPARAAGAAKWVEPLFRPRPSPDGEARVALTLDACPGGFDRRIADMLVKEQVKATIFLTERWMHRNPDGLALLLDHRDLFALENHGARHIPPILGAGTMFGLPVAGTIETLRRDIEDGASAIAAATGTRPSWYRGATARYSPDAIPDIESMGFRLAAYSLSADRGASLPAAAAARRMAKAKDGDVLIGHINQPRRPSGEGIAEGIVALRRAGLSFVHLNEIDPAIAPA
jgi:peptidoglycan/xylan/chitin deacetylase (PgdA/CDA1 family)